MMELVSKIVGENVVVEQPDLLAGQAGLAEQMITQLHDMGRMG